MLRAGHQLHPSSPVISFKYCSNSVDSSGKITLANESGNIVARHEGNKLHLHGYSVNVDERPFWNFTSKRGKRVDWPAKSGSGDWFAEPRNEYGVLVYAYRGLYPE